MFELVQRQGREDSEPRDGFWDEVGAFEMLYQWQPWQNTDEVKRMEADIQQN